ncbi:MAG: TPM domain-containing protein [Gemmatales bacterium]|nr:TPM domain-containing protein [Gemmatales bacterium]MDW7993243.1 TPM domain-containing protein [Gemmatales bacterium]
MPRPLAWITVFTALSILLPKPAWGQVFDEGQFFHRATLVQADKELRKLGEKHQLVLVIETFARPPSDLAEFAKIPDKRPMAFRSWAEKRRAAHRAHLYILICRDPARFEITWHETLTQRLPQEQLDTLRSTLLQRLRAKQYDQALLETVTWLNQALSGTAQKPSPAQTPAPADDTNSPSSGNPSPSTKWSWVFWAILLGLGILIVLALLRGLMYALSNPAQPSSVPPEQAGTNSPVAAGSYSSAPTFLSSFLAGMFGAALGSWLYDRFFRGAAQGAGPEAPATAPTAGPTNVPTTENPLPPYAPEAGSVWTTGADFDQAEHELSGSGAPAEDFEPDYGIQDEPTDYGADFGDSDVAGSDFAGGDFGNDF